MKHWLVEYDTEFMNSVTDMMQCLHWCRLDQRRIDNKLSLMYKITHNHSKSNCHPHFWLSNPTCKTILTLSPLVLQAANCYEWLQIFILSKRCYSLEQPFARNCGLPHLGAVQSSSLQDWSLLTKGNHHTFIFKPNQYYY